MYRYVIITIVFSLVLPLVGCDSGAVFRRPSFIPASSPKPVVVFRSAQQMAATPWPQPSPRSNPNSRSVQQPQSGPQLREVPDAQERNNVAQAEKSPQQLLDEARLRATEGPTPNGFIHAAQVYSYVPNKVYTVVTSPGYVTTIKLQPGEKLVSTAAGDTSQWIVDDVDAGISDETARNTSVISPTDEPVAAVQTLVLIKPRQPFLNTNFVLTTSQRTYLIDLMSVDKPTYHSAVTWTYPKDELVIKRGEVPTRSMAQYQPSRHRQPPGHIYQYNVLIQKGMTPPPWTPNRVYDDGFRTHVHFPNVIDRHSLPPLFGVDSDGKLQLLNYRVENNQYIINRLIDRAELRYGPHRVGIQRINPSQP